MKIFGKVRLFETSGLIKHYINVYPVIYIQHINMFGGWVHALMFGGRLMIDLYLKSHTHYGGDGDEIRNEDIIQEHLVITWQAGMDSPQHTFRV